MWALNDDEFAMLIGRNAGRALSALAAAGLCTLACAPASAVQAPVGGAASLAPAHESGTVSADIRQLVQWIADSGDNQGRPFAVVDKRAARIVLFEPGGRIVGAAPALLGLAIGDHAVPGLGAIDPADIAPADRTTPAGRFASEPGRNLSGEAVVWFDYDAGLAIHRVRPGDAREARGQRLASPSAEDNRVSLGCVVVAPDFFDAVVQPLLGRRHGVVYVLPETRPVHAVFGGGRTVMRRP